MAEAAAILESAASFVIAPALKEGKVVYAASTGG